MEAYIKAAIIASTSAPASCAAPGGAGTARVKRHTSNTCIVTDNKLGSMGDPVTKVYGNQEVKFCCQPCVAKYEKNPERYAHKLQ